MTASLQLLFLLVWSFACHSQDIYPTCTDTVQCLTLTHYAWNAQIHSDPSVKLVLHGPDKHKLTSDLVVKDTSDFSIISDKGRQIVIDCEHKASLKFQNVSNLVIENVTFVSCGKISPQDIECPGIALQSVSGSFMNVGLSESSNGALLVTNSQSLTFHNLYITNNHNSSSNIVHIEKSNISITGTTIISNNSVTQYDQKNEMLAVFRIDEECNVSFENLIVSENIGPNGIVSVYKFSLVGYFNWTFQSNVVCSKGTLTLDESSANITGNLFFLNNTVSDECRSVAGMLVTNSNFHIIGDIDFVSNMGRTIAIESLNSQITVNGSLNLIRNGFGHRGVSLGKNSALTVTNTLNARSNSLIREVFKAKESDITIESESFFLENTLSTPVVVLNGDLRLYGRVNFANNAGAVFAFESHVYIAATSNFTNNSYSNDYLDGTVALEHSRLYLSGSYSFIHNRVPKKYGGAIFATQDCKLYISGSGNFIENSALYGGAIYVDQRSQINLMRGTALLFQKNQAIKGGAIFLQTTYQYVHCPSIRCLFLLEENSKPEDVSLIFIGNTGTPGGSVLHVNIEQVDFLAEKLTFPAVDDLRKTFTLPDNSNNTEPLYHSDSFLFCFCTNDGTNKCELDKRKSRTVVRGKPFNVTVRALVLYGDFTEKPVRSRKESAPDPASSIFSFTVTDDNCFQRVDSSRVNNMNCTELGLSVGSVHPSETIKLNIGESFLDEDKTLYLDLTFEDSCPIGFVLDNRNATCICDSRIQGYLEVCDITKGIFSKKSDSPRFWMGSFDNTSDFLFYRACPSGYCIALESFTLSNDSICASNRAGRLCGECTNGYSLLLGGVKCEDCSRKNSYLALLIVFAALGVILVALIFLTQATVAMGTINGLILYINLIDANQNIFLPSDFFRGYTIFISWLNLDFGIQTCFYDGMNQLEYAAWQFVFPLYLWLMVGGIVLACRYSMKISAFFGSSNPVAVLATLILLTYNTLVQNIITIFSPAHLIDLGDSTVVVWLYNGEISYATGFHIGLIVAAVVFLVLFFAPYTLVLTAAQLLQKLDCTSKILQRLRLIPFINAYQAPFKPAHRYWVGLCLMMRAILLVIFAVAENENTILLAMITFCVVSLSMFGITGGVYDKHWQNILEISFILNLVILSAARLYVTKSNDIIAYLSVTVAFITFLGIVIFHIFEQLKKQRRIKEAFEKLKTKLISKRSKKKATKDEATSLEVQPVDQSFQVDLREPLLESQITTKIT